MPEELKPGSLHLDLTANIVAANVRRDQVGSDELATLISTVHAALSGLGKAAAETEVDRTPAVSIRRSVHRDYVVCLECGWRGQTLRRHLTSHGLSEDQYRARWKLPRDHPLTAPSYLERRSGLAKQLGLGRGRRQSRRNRRRSHPKPWQHPNNLLGDEEDNDQQPRRGSQERCPTLIVIGVVIAQNG